MTKAYFVCHIGPIFRYLWFMPSLGVRSPWIWLYFRFRIRIGTTLSTRTKSEFLIVSRDSSGAYHGGKVNIGRILESRNSRLQNSWDQLIDITHFVSKIAWICLVIVCRIVLLFTKIYIKIYINCSVPAVNFYWRENKIFGHKIRNCEKRSKKIKNKHVIVLKIENLYMQSKHQHAVLKLIQL